MPIIVHAETRRLSQEEFRAISYEVMRRIFDIHNRFGRLFEEDVYQSELVRHCDAKVEVPIEIQHGGFATFLFMDVLVSGGAVFELKAVDALHDRHRAQLIQYLLMAELSHGKLVNLRSDAVEHEFVNANLTRADRIAFTVDDVEWDSSFNGAQDLRHAIEALLRDIGTGLDVSLYEDVIAHMLGGNEHVLQDVEILSGDQRIGTQKLRLSSPQSHFRITSLDARSQAGYGEHLRRFLKHTTLDGIQWINVTRHEVRFTTIGRASVT